MGQLHSVKRYEACLTNKWCTDIYPMFNPSQGSNPRLWTSNTNMFMGPYNLYGKVLSQIGTFIHNKFTTLSAEMYSKGKYITCMA